MSHRPASARRRGFTLTELLVAMALSVLLLGAILTLALAISAQVQSSNAAAMAEEELRTVEEALRDWFSSHDSAGHPAPTAAGDRLSFGAEAVYFTLRPDAEGPGGVVHLGEETLTVTCLREVGFEVGEQPNLVKCTLVFEIEGERSSRVLMLLKRSVNLEEGT